MAKYVGTPIDTALIGKSIREMFIEALSKERRKVKTPRKAPDTAKNVFEQRKRWPKACLKCGGDGAKLVDDRETSEEIVIDLCEYCLGIGKCPRCASPLPKGWQEKVEAMNKAAMQEDGEVYAVASCRKCGWEDGDDPVLNLFSEDKNGE